LFIVDVPPPDKFFVDEFGTVDDKRVAVVGNVLLFV
jgi:hypothetical protein